MSEGITETVKPSSTTYEAIEAMIRSKVQEYIQTILEDEVETFLGRKKSERIRAVDGTAYTPIDKTSRCTHSQRVSLSAYLTKINN
jgi:hypothetical protein